MSRHDHYDPFTQPPEGKKHVLLRIPKSGLFYDGGAFFDGDMNRLRFDGVIHVFPSHARAETAKKKHLERYPDSIDQMVVMGCRIHEIEERAGDIDHLLEATSDPTDS